ncbi:MAG: peptidyl-prolyl cis-trans isomerase [Acidobacteriales bacterium]|nr:peptidyl-prolyl cis-trans isomerase [Terriglobales bacterium]
MNAAIITIDGVCDKAATGKRESANDAAGKCKTIITREEFENLIQPTTPVANRRQIATRYATALVMSQKGREMGLDKGPKFDALMRAVRAQVLAQQLTQALQEKAGQIPDKDIEDYYQKNSVAFEQADLERLIVPRSKQLEAPKQKLSEADEQKRRDAAEASMKAEADALQKRAAVGEDFTKLQDEAYQAAGFKVKAPTPKMENVRRNTLPPTQAVVMDLKPGEVSSVIADQSGYYIFKVEKKGEMPLDQVREEIRNTLRTQRMQESMQSIQQAATPTLDENYFGSSVPGGRPGSANVPTNEGNKPTLKSPSPDPK